MPPEIPVKVGALFSVPVHFEVTSIEFGEEDEAGAHVYVVGYQGKGIDDGYAAFPLSGKVRVSVEKNVPRGRFIVAISEAVEAVLFVAVKG